MSQGNSLLVGIHLGKRDILIRKFLGLLSEDDNFNLYVREAIRANIKGEMISLAKVNVNDRDYKGFMNERKSIRISSAEKEIYEVISEIQSGQRSKYIKQCLNSCIDLTEEKNEELADSLLLEAKGIIKLVPKKLTGLEKSSSSSKVITRKTVQVTDDSSSEILVNTDNQVPTKEVSVQNEEITVTKDISTPNDEIAATKDVLVQNNKIVATENESAQIASHTKDEKESSNADAFLRRVVRRV